MENSDIRSFRAADIWVALGLLTRLPLPARAWDARRAPALAAWAYPLAGLMVAAIAGAAGALALWLGTPPGFAAALVLACLSLLTGAMHEDGLADSADGLWGGHDAARRLEIMKDSHIGAYGVIALIASFALRWSALSALLAADQLWGAILVTAVTSRAAMVAVMHALPHARETGLAHMTGRPGRAAVFLATGLAAAACLSGFGGAGIMLLLTSLAAALACGAIAKTKIAGQTGDILGATQQVSEIALLGTICALTL